MKLSNFFKRVFTCSKYMRRKNKTKAKSRNKSRNKSKSGRKIKGG